MRVRCPFLVFLSVAVGLCLSHLSPLPHCRLEVTALTLFHTFQSVESLGAVSLALALRGDPKRPEGVATTPPREVIRVSQHPGGSWLRKLGVEQGSWAGQPPPGNEWEGKT